MRYRKPTAAKVRDAYRQAWQEWMGEPDKWLNPKEIAEKSIHAPKDDRGEWAPDSLCVQYYGDYGLPCPDDFTDPMEIMAQIDRRVREITGFNVHTELVNRGIGAVYED